MPVYKFGRMSDAKTRDTGVSLTYINNNYIRSDGGTPVSSSIDLKSNTLYNVVDPVNRQDVATKEYADNRPHIIAVQTRYSGPLREGEYQFKFGGGNNGNYEEIIGVYENFKGSTTGFLMPQSGCIKKIKMEMIEVADINEIPKNISENLGEEKAKEFKEEVEDKGNIIEFIPFISGDLFNVVKFEKHLNKEDYIQPYYNPPKILSSFLSNSSKCMGVVFSIDKLKKKGW